MTTPRDLIKDALEDIGAIGVGDSIPGDQSTGLFNRLNRMLANWSTNGALIFADTLISHTLTSGDGEYTIGSGGDINTTKPTKIKDAYYRAATIDYNLEIIDEFKYNRIAIKSLQGGYPDYLYYKTGHPLGTIKLYPLPSAAHTLFLEAEVPLTAFTGLSQTVSLPEGYEEAIQYNFAKRVAGAFGRTLTPEQETLAREGLADIKRANRKNDFFEVTIDAPGKRYDGFDIYSGPFR